MLVSKGKRFYAKDATQLEIFLFGVKSRFKYRIFLRECIPIFYPCTNKFCSEKSKSGRQMVESIDIKVVPRNSIIQNI